MSVLFAFFIVIFVIMLIVDCVDVGLQSNNHTEYFLVIPHAIFFILLFFGRIFCTCQFMSAIHLQANFI